jgi:hypothetical protein
LVHLPVVRPLPFRSPTAFQDVAVDVVCRATPDHENIRRYDVSANTKEGPPVLLRRLLIIALLVPGDARPSAAQAPEADTDLWKECRNQQSDEALGACTQIIDSDTEHGARLAQAFNLRAVIHQRLGQPEQAIADFSRGIQLMRDAGQSGWELAFIYFMRANTYRAKGDLDQGS